MKTPYWEKLKDPRWQRKRLEILERDGFSCQECFDVDSTLNVHHKYYVKGREPWDYPGVCYVTFCDNCHEMYHDEEASGGSFMFWEKIVTDIFGEDINWCPYVEELVGILIYLRSKGMTSNQFSKVILNALKSTANETTR